MKLKPLHALSGFALLAAGMVALYPITSTSVTGALWMDALHLPAAVLLMYWLSFFGKEPPGSADNNQPRRTKSAKSDKTHPQDHLIKLRLLTNVRPQHLRSYVVFKPVIAIVVLTVLEIMQDQVGRNAQWTDIFHGSLGILVFYSKGYLPRFGHVLFAFLCLMIASRSLFSYWLYQYQLHINSPQLIIQPWLDTTFGWHAINQSVIQRELAADGQLMLTALLKKSQYQGIEWRNPQLDFSTVAELCFSARGSDNLQLSLRIDDEHSFNYQSRYNSTFSIGPNWQRFCLDMNQLPTLRQIKLDNKKLTSIYLFSKATKEGSGTSAFTIANMTIWSP